MNVIKNTRLWVLHKNSFCKKNFQIRPRVVLSEVCRYESTANNFAENPYFHKYSKKLDEMKTLHPVEFESRLEKMKTNPFKTVVSVKEKQNVDSVSRKSHVSHTRPKKLDDILRLDMVDTLPSEEISKLWREHFQKKDGICAIIPSNIYEKIHNNSLDYPMFLYPLVKGSGYEFILGQFSDHTCYFTSLANFQVHKDNSPVCLTLVHFPELIDNKKIVLMRGEFDSDALDVSEAQFLANQVQLYYSSEDGTRKHFLLRAFNKDPKNFKHIDLITEIERLQ